jgi:sterol 3beta-glucosyltransferase
MEIEGHIASEDEPEDFEHATPRPVQEPTPRPEKPTVPSRVMQDAAGSTSSSRPTPARSGTMATVRIQRRARLADKLKEVFELEGIEEVWAGKGEFS